MQSFPTSANKPGEVAEWLNVPDSKSGVGASSSGVRIPPSPPISRETWIDCQLTSNLLTSFNTSTIGFSVALPVTLAVLYGHVAHLWLALWGTAVMVLVAHRYWTGRSLSAIDWRLQPSDWLKEFSRKAWSWPWSAAIWSASLFLYFHRVPLENQFICLVILVGIGSFSVALMGARLDVFKRYVDCLALVSLLAMATHTLSSLEADDALQEITLMLLVAVFWQLLRKTGTRQHASLRQSFGLQYDNEQLIRDLRAQSALAFEAVEVKERMLANAAHDLRQPIHALAFYAELLRSEPASSAEVVPKILVATDSVNTLFNSLFDFAAMELKGIQVQPQAMPVCELINQMMVQFAPAARAKNLQLRSRIQPAYVVTDPLLIQRVLGNLLANAIRYSAQGGVLITSRVRRGRVWLEVWDTGLGISPQHLPYVFREFYKVPTLGTVEGFGLGLAIVERLCGALGHSVSVRSRLGRGSCFRIELAQATALPSAVSSAEPSDPSEPT